MDHLEYWRNHQQELEENLRKFDSDSVIRYGGNKIGLMSGNVYNLFHQFQKSDQPTDEIPRWSLSQEESRRSEAAGKTVGKPGVSGSSCGVVHMMNPQNGLLLDHGRRHVKMTPAGGISSALGSLESLDCLLSTSSGQTAENTSVEDDGISMIFSDCENGRNNFTGNRFDSAAKSVPSAALLSSGNGKGGPGTTDTQLLPHTLSDDRAMINHDSRSSATGIFEPKRLWNFTRNFDSSGKYAEVFSTNNARGRGKDSETFSQTPAGERAKKTVLSGIGSSPAGCEINATKRRRLEKTQNLEPTNSRSGKRPISSSNISFQKASSTASSADEPDSEAIAQLKEIIYRAAAFRPVHLGEENLEKPKRKNVKISKDPQTVAARQRRERISEKIRVLQRLVPGGSKMDTASMLDEAANYLKFLRSQIKALEAPPGYMKNHHHNLNTSFSANLAFSPFLNLPFTMLPPPPLLPQFSIGNPNVIHHQFER